MTNPAAAALPREPRIVAYQRWLERERGLRFADYDALWQWSVTELDAFWQSMWDFHGLVSPTPHTAVLADERMPGAQWFPGAQLNYARQVLRHAEAAQAAGCLAIVHADEAMLARGELGEVSWGALAHQVAHAPTVADQARGQQQAAQGPQASQVVLAAAALVLAAVLQGPDHVHQELQVQLYQS